MKKLLATLLSASFISTYSWAQEIDLVADLVQEDPILKDNTSSEKNTTGYDVQKDEEQVADDRGIFSFLNFSFIKKTFSGGDDETTDTPQSGEQKDIKETPLQRKIRRAQEGNLDAQLALGYMYLYGENGVKADPEQAFKYYEMAAGQNSPIAQNNLGSLYFNGIGTERNYLKAAQQFALAAQNGSDDAAVNLAFIYLSSKGKDNMRQEAINLFTQAAKAGNNTAKFMAGYAYYKGFQVEKNDHKAIALIRQAADAQFDEAQYVLALMYLNGQGVAQNFGNAVKYMRAAAMQGNLQATMHLANILAEGVIYERDLPQAHILYNIAAIDNTPNAATRRDIIKNSLKIDELLQAQEEAEAFKAHPSELTSYIRQTFGANVRRYIDDNITGIK